MKGKEKREEVTRKNVFASIKTRVNDLHVCGLKDSVLLIFSPFLYIYIYFYMSAQKKKEIQTSDFYFIKCSPNRLKYLLRTRLFIYIYQITTSGSREIVQKMLCKKCSVSFSWVNYNYK